MTLFPDNRVGSKELKNVVNVPCELTHLEYGDACFMGNGPEDVPYSIGVERKTITDLLNSMTTGRLVGHQLEGMLNAYNVIYILVEGTWRVGPSSGLVETYKGKGWSNAGWHNQRFMGTAVFNFLNTLAIMCNARIWISQNKTQSGRWLSSTYRWWEKSWDQHKALNTFHTENAPMAHLVRPSILQRVAKEFKGVGWDKAKAIQEKFRTVFDFVLANESALQEIPGIGKKLAKQITDEYHCG